MLWFKAWLETRSRFLLSLFGMVAICSLDIVHWNANALPDTRISYYYSGLLSAHSLLAIMWLLAVTLLSMGGLLREKAAGASAFTLTLPVSRTRLMAIRIATVFFQAVALAVFPWLTILAIESIGGTLNTATLNTATLHAGTQSTFHLALLLGGGLVFFALAILVASLVEGEYTAPVASFGLLLGLAVTAGSSFLRPYSPWAFMVGADYLNIQSSLLTGPVPWLHVAANLLVTVLILGLAVRVIQTREF